MYMTLSNPPAAQSVHEVEPVESAYVPAAHIVQDVEAVEAWEYPTAHSVHTLLPADAEYEPKDEIGFLILLIMCAFNCSDLSYLRKTRY